MRVSIALCTWYGERFLQPQLDSLLAQTRLPDELVISDDASGDGTWAMLQAFSAQARARGIRVDLQRNPVNLGYVDNFAGTLARTGGDLIFLCDQDDVWHPHKIERMAAEFARRPQLGLLHTDARLVDAEGRDLGHGLFEALEMTRAEIAAEHAGQGFEVLLRRNTVTGATAALRREMLDGALPVPAGWVHDEWLALSTSLRAQVDCLEWASIDYRQHGANQIGVRLRSLSEKVAGGRVPKRAFMAGVEERLGRFLQRCDQAGLVLPPARRAELEARIAHARFRAALPRGGFARIRMVLVEMANGGYRRYSSGARSVVSDLLDLN